jgi:hypothetical protein
MGYGEWLDQLKAKNDVATGRITANEITELISVAGAYMDRCAELEADVSEIAKGRDMMRLGRDTLKTEIAAVCGTLDRVAENIRNPTQWSDMPKVKAGPLALYALEYIDAQVKRLRELLEGGE